MSIIAGALALAVVVSPAAHAGGTVDQPPRTKAERIAHHHHVVHHRQVVKQRIRERQHGSTTPTPPVKTPPPPVKTPAPNPVKPTPVTVRPAAPTHQVVVPVHQAVHHKVHHRVVVTPVRPDVVPIAAAPVRHRQAAPAAVHHGPRPEVSAAAPATHLPAAPKPTPAATPTPHSHAPAIVTVPRHVVQYVKHEVDSMLPAVKIGFGLLCVIGLLMMGYAVAIGRRPTA